MNNNRHGRDGIDIPNWLIIVALISAFPLGVVLLVVKVLSGSAGPELMKGMKDAVSEISSEGAKYREKFKRAVSEMADESGRNRNVKRRKKLKKIRPQAGEVFSWIFTVVMMLSAFSRIDDLFGGGIAGAAKFAVSAAVSAVSAGIALSFRSSRERYELYRGLIGEKTRMSLSSLASMTGNSMSKVIRDISRMINRRYLGDEAYIDVSRDSVFMTREAGNEYSRAYDAYEERTERADKVSGEETIVDEKPFQDRVKKDEFRSIILEIRRLNDEIADIAVSDRIYRIEEHTQHIFDYVKEHPEKKNNIRTFMNYYLPTTLKLLEAYAEIEKVGVAGENMKRSKESIEKTLDLLAEGFERQLDTLYESKNIDISSDIEVLETMMKKDGMIDSFSVGSNIRFADGKPADSEGARQMKMREDGDDN